MQLEAILTPARTLCCAASSSKKRILEDVSQFIGEDVRSLDPNELFASLINRERLGSTGLGQGIAIPHCRLRGCSSIIGSLVTLETPIDFEAMDEQPVDILFILIVPEEANQEHLDTLAGLAQRFSKPEYCHQLRAARSNEELYRAAVAN